MVDLTKYINPMKMELDDHETEEPHRPYLGFSGAADECARKVWFTWRWASPKYLTRRMRRLFSRGEQEEEVIIADLESIGMVVTNRQAEMIHTLMGRHSQGHIDGEVENVPTAEKTKHLLEMKTMADKYFSALVNDGVMRSDPKYYGQVQLYMRYRKLTRTLFIATNKNNDKRVYERITFDPIYAEDLHKKITDIISSDIPPIGVSDDPSFYLCRRGMCSHREVCYKRKPPEKNCRTCANADVCDDGVWECSFHNKELSEDEQRAGCDHHKRLF